MTVNQRRQAIDFGKIMGTGMHIPSGMIGAAARAHILNIYYEKPVIPSVVYFWRNRNLVNTAWVPKVTPSDGSTQII